MTTNPPPPSPWPVIFAAFVILASLAVARDCRAEIITDPALVCAAARTGNGAWLDLPGLRKCLAAEKLREVDAREITQLREALRVESAELEWYREWRWHWLGGSAVAGAVVAVLVVGWVT